MRRAGRGLNAGEWRNLFFVQSPRNRFPSREDATKPIEVDVVVEVPRGSFLKRGSTGRVDFISPLPCPFNYGSVPQYLGLEGDLLDAVVLVRDCPSVVMCG